MFTSRRGRSGDWFSARSGGTVSSPYGAFWFSDDSDYGWLQWCEENEYNSDGLRYAHSIGFMPGTRILVADSLGALDDLHREYSYIPDWADSARSPLASSLQRWDYRRLAGEYDALIISPYQWEHRGNWRPYSGWDCASGVVFDVSRVELGARDHSRDTIEHFRPPCIHRCPIGEAELCAKMKQFRRKLRRFKSSPLDPRPGVA